MKYWTDLWQNFKFLFFLHKKTYNFLRYNGCNVYNIHCINGNHSVSSSTAFSCSNEGLLSSSKKTYREGNATILNDIAKHELLRVISDKNLKIYFLQNCRKSALASLSTWEVSSALVRGCLKTSSRLKKVILESKATPDSWWTCMSYKQETSYWTKTVF